MMLRKRLELSRRCAKKSLVPFVMEESKTLTPYRGVGKNKISFYGQVKCEIFYKNKTIEHTLFVLPDDEAVVPLLIGRHRLSKFNIQIKTKYKRNELKKLNCKNKELTKEVIIVLMSLILYRVSNETGLQ
ncbi:hypothetical protein DOY81_010566 [Sarcophaga bullata]|nr:hypothetical protein DOY81_010566 [Sarcophaga bullata]